MEVKALAIHFYIEREFTFDYVYCDNTIKCIAILDSQ